MDEIERQVQYVRLRNGCAAIDVLYDWHYLRDAYTATVAVLDMIYLYEHGYGVVFDDIPVELAIDIKKELEQELELGDRKEEITAPEVIRETRLRKEAGKRFLAGAVPSELQKNQVAEFILQSRKYPNAKREYIIQDLEAHVLFDHRCQDGSLRLLVREKSNETQLYSRPVSYMLERVDSKLQSAADTDLDRLLRSWGY